MNGLEKTRIQLGGFTDLVSVQICSSVYGPHQIEACQRRTEHDSMLLIIITMLKGEF